MPKLPWNAIELAVYLLAAAGTRDDPSANDSRGGRGGQIGRQQINRRRRFKLIWLPSAFCSLLALAVIGQNAAGADTASQETQATPGLIWRLALLDQRTETRQGFDGRPSAHFEVTIVNGSGIYVRRLYLAGTLRQGKSSKRGAFVWHVPGGLRAGQATRLDLSPALLGFLRGAPNAISSGDFKVEVIGFEDENGRVFGDFALK